MANKYYVIDLENSDLHEFENKTDADVCVTELLSIVDDDKIVIIYGEELSYDVKAFIKKEG